MSRLSLVHRLMKADRHCQSCRVVLDANIRNHSPYLVSSLDGPKLLCRLCERSGCTLDGTHESESIPKPDTWSDPEPEPLEHWIPDENAASLIDQLLEVVA
jgi:hypothetical protein